jgi:hypothetical protein
LNRVAHISELAANLVARIAARQGYEVPKTQEKATSPAPTQPQASTSAMIPAALFERSMSSGVSAEGGSQSGGR